MFLLHIQLRSILDGLDPRVLVDSGYSLQAYSTYIILILEATTYYYSSAVFIMAEQAVTAYVPLDVPLPPIPEGQVFSDLQWRTLLSLADTVIPSIRSTSLPKSVSTKVVPESTFKDAVSTLASHIHDPDATQIAEQYLEENASANPQFVEGLRRFSPSISMKKGKAESISSSMLSSMSPPPSLLCRLTY